jgi:hypothetical protein
MFDRRPIDVWAAFFMATMVICEVLLAFKVMP